MVPNKSLIPVYEMIEARNNVFSKIGVPHHGFSLLELQFLLRSIKVEARIFYD
jgi:hypothetical protein